MEAKDNDKERDKDTNAGDLKQTDGSGTGNDSASGNYESNGEQVEGCASVSTCGSSAVDKEMPANKEQLSCNRKSTSTEDSNTIANPDGADLSSSFDKKNVNSDDISSKESHLECSEATGNAAGGTAGEDREAGAWVRDTENEGAAALHIHNRDDDYEYDDDDDNDDNGFSLTQRPVKKIKKCFSCGKLSVEMKKCGACKEVTYCDRNCQKENWKAHKGACANYRRFAEQRSSFESNFLFRLKYGPIETQSSLQFIRHPLEDMVFNFSLLLRNRPKRYVILEIVGEYPHLFRPACVVKDMEGNQTHVLFYTGPICIIYGGIPIPLSLALVPGTFICLIDPIWHRFLDGTVGIRIDHADEFELIY